LQLGARSLKERAKNSSFGLVQKFEELSVKRVLLYAKSLRFVGNINADQALDILSGRKTIRRCSMTSRSSVMMKTMAWIMVLSLTQVFVLANRSGKTSEVTSKNESASVIASAEMPLGRLVADGPVTINGIKARTGDTVFPGALIQTVPGIGASVQIGTLGQLDISPETKLVLNYDRGSISSEINTGCAVLATNNGVQGLLTMPSGITKKNRLDSTVLSACSDSEVNAVDVSGAKSVRVGAPAPSSVTLGAGSVGFAEFGSMMFSSTAMLTGFNAIGNQPVAAALNGVGCCCCCCCCCNPSVSIPCQPCQ
jgi:hypothetical protein